MDVVAGLRGDQQVSHPLLDTARRLCKLDERTGFAVGTPTGEGWLSLDELASDTVVSTHLDALEAEKGGLRNVAAAQLASSLACCVVRPLMAILHTEYRVPELGPDSLRVLARGAELVRLAVDPAALYVLATDPEAGEPYVHTMPEASALLEQAAVGLHASLSPVLRTIRTHGRFGLPLLWGTVLDMVGATSLLTARIAGLDQRLAWRHAQALCLRLQALAVQPQANQPRPFPVVWSGGEALYTVKGTCCLQYREYGLRAGESQHSDAYCKTCPFVSDEVRETQCRVQLERDMRGHDGFTSAAMPAY